MGFWEGWWWNELTRPNDKYKHIPEVELDYEVLGKAQAYIEKHEPEWLEEGIRTGEQMRYQEGGQDGIKDATLERLRKGEGVNSAKSLGFKSPNDLADALEAGKINAYMESGEIKFRMN